MIVKETLSQTDLSNHDYPGKSYLQNAFNPGLSNSAAPQYSPRDQPTHKSGFQKIPQSPLTHVTKVSKHIGDAERLMDATAEKCPQPACYVQHGAGPPDSSPQEFLSPISELTIPV